MSISIITVTFNSSREFETLLKSIITNERDYLDQIEIIVVDNNSSDINKLTSIVLISQLKLKIRLIKRKKNYGFADSCNYGSKLAEFDTILFLNPDTVISVNALRILREHMLSSKSDIIGGCIHKVGSPEVHRSAFNPVNIRTMILEFSSLGKIFRLNTNFYVNQKSNSDIKVGGVSAAYMMIDKKTFTKIGRFDNNFFMYLEDVDICTTATKENHKVSYCPHSVIIHVGGASSKNELRINKGAWVESRNYFRLKHFSKQIVVSTLLKLLYFLEEYLLKVRKIIINHL